MLASTQAEGAHASHAPFRPPAYLGASAGASSSRASSVARPTSHRSTHQRDPSSAETMHLSDNNSVPGAVERAEAGVQLQTRLSRARSSSPAYPSCAPLAAGLTQTRSEPGAIYIEWQEGDQENPYNWKMARKVPIVLVCFFYALTTAINATSYPSARDGALEDLNTTTIKFLLGNFTYLSVGIAFTPLLLAPLSEIYGRTPIYLAAAALFAILYIPQALAQNITAVIISRLFQGAAASVGNSMVGGTVSDLFAAHDRGLPMSLFCLAIFIGQAIGPVAGSYTAAGTLGWRWIPWWNGIIGLISFCAMSLILKETRGPVLLSRRAARLTKETGKLHRCQADDERTGFWTAVRISLARPAWWLVSEPIVLFFSLWIGFLWGAIFLLLSAVPVVFDVYGWTPQQKSLVLLSIAAGGFLGWLAHLHQERLYERACVKAAPEKPAPEARLYWACVGAILAPAAMFMFAWTGQASVHPAAPIVALVIFLAAIFPIYLSVFVYIADVYDRYASSGLAAQSWLRNVFAGIFPLFTPPMYNNLTPRVASSIVGGVAAIMGIVPFLLIRYGAHVRAHSKVAQSLAALDREAEEKVANEKAKRERWERRRVEKENIMRLKDGQAHGEAARDGGEKEVSQMA